MIARRVASSLSQDNAGWVWLVTCAAVGDIGWATAGMGNVSCSACTSVSDASAIFRNDGAVDVLADDRSNGDVDRLNTS